MTKHKYSVQYKALDNTFNKVLELCETREEAAFILQEIACGRLKAKIGNSKRGIYRAVEHREDGSASVFDWFTIGVVKETK